MDTCKALGDYRLDAEIHGHERRVLPRRALAVIDAAHNHASAVFLRPRGGIVDPLRKNKIPTYTECSNGKAVSSRPRA